MAAVAATLVVVEQTLYNWVKTDREGKLTPALGYVFNRKWLDPCESLVSILRKFERANGAHSAP